MLRVRLRWNSRFIRVTFKIVLPEKPCTGFLVVHLSVGRGEIPNFLISHTLEER